MLGLRAPRHQAGVVPSSMIASKSICPFQVMAVEAVNCACHLVSTWGE